MSVLNSVISHKSKLLFIRSAQKNKWKIYQQLFGCIVISNIQYITKGNFMICILKYQHVMINKSRNKCYQIPSQFSTKLCVRHNNTTLLLEKQLLVQKCQFMNIHDFFHKFPNGALKRCQITVIDHLRRSVVYSYIFWQTIGTSYFFSCKDLFWHLLR